MTTKEIEDTEDYSKDTNENLVLNDLNVNNDESIKL